MIQPVRHGGPDCIVEGCPVPANFRDKAGTWCRYHVGVHPDDRQAVTAVLKQHHQQLDEPSLGAKVVAVLRHRIESNRK